jgi:broad specificity phosphatase PhoE
VTPEKKIILVRHGTTAYNEADILQGRIDNPLSPRGIEECRLLAEALEREELDIIFHSSLKRARQTAEIVNKSRKVGCKSVESFVEIDLGEWEGIPYPTVVDQNPAFFEQWLSDPSVAIPGGESFLHVFERVGPGVREVLDSGYDHVLIVGHATVNRGILANLLKMEPAVARLFRMRNASYSKLMIQTNSRSRRILVENWNVTAHLKDLQ